MGNSQMLWACWLVFHTLRTTSDGTPKSLRTSGWSTSLYTVFWLCGISMLAFHDHQAHLVWWRASCSPLKVTSEGLHDRWSGVCRVEDWSLYEQVMIRTQDKGWLPPSLTPLGAVNWRQHHGYDTDVQEPMCRGITSTWVAWHGRLGWLHKQMP